ncbi:calmodulin-binding transcription activator [Elysia marginata]|uniref:Calmodulin-binding transcription activator n=1 Tax=Elysia marginata TaxID=1093978 RepID=A0AAV4FI31_9GAST|nr:calmodulin-binding transcription activator [Elysia marginata]
MDQNDLTADSREDVNCVSNIKLPAQLQKITPAQEFVSEIASILIAFDHHKEWLVLPQKIRPASGSMLLYNRKVVFYRRDGYCWKKRRNGSTIREDHMKLKVQGLECIYGSYVHSAILPTFHRRCYWLLQNPNIVLIHYLNVPYPEAAKPSIRPVSYELRSKEWSKEELVDQLRPMLSSVCAGMEHDVEKDQKLEKMLEEILMILMPLHEGSANKPVLTEPKSLASEPFGPSPTVGEVSQTEGPPTNITASAWRNQQQLLVTHSQQSSQPSIIPSSTVGAASISSSLDRGGSGRSILTVNGGDCQGLVTQLLPQDLVVANAAGNNKPRLITLNGNQLVVANRSQASLNSPSTSANVDTTEGGSNGTGKVITIHTQQNISASRTGIKTETFELPNVSSSGVSSQVQNGNTTPIFSSAPGEFHILSPPIPNNSISVKESHLRQQHQQRSSTDSLLQTQHHHHQKQGSQESTPVLTLHLKPTNSSTSDSPGFVLSLQGATIVSQHSGLSSTSAEPRVSSSSSSPTGLSQTSSAGGLVLVASQSPGGGLVLNKISPQPQPQAQNAPFSAQLNTAPGAPSASFATPFPNVGSSSMHLNSGLRVPMCEASSKTFTTSMGQATKKHSIPQHLLFSSAGPSRGTDCIIYNNNTSQTLPFGSTTCGSNVCSRLQPATSLSQNRTSKATEINMSHTQTPNISTSNSILDMNNRNLLPEKVVCATSMFSYLQVPSQSHPFINSSFPTTVDMEEISTQCHTSQPQQQQQQQEIGKTEMLRPATKFEISQQQRFETISPPTVTLNSDPTAGYVFNVGSQAISNSVVLATMDSGNPSQNNACQATETAKPPGELLAPLQTNTNLTGGQARSSCFNNHFTKASSLQGSMFVFDTDQSSQSQDVHVQPHLTPNAQDSNPHLMACTSSVLQTSIKNMMTNPSSCDTLDGSFSSLPSTDLNLDDLLDLNDLDDVSDLGCSPFTPPDLTQEAADLDKVSLGSESVAVHSNVENLSTYCCTQTNTSYLLQQQKQEQQQQQQQIQHQHLHLTVPQTSSSSADHQAPSSPHHPGAPPRPLHSMSICDTLAPGQQASDPEINSVIKDFSPEWAYVKTNTKILIAGPWCSEGSQYSCVFDGVHIPAILVQMGLLRCYTLYHRPGYATLQVARDGVIISNCEVFEFCDKEGSNPSIAHPEWFAFDIAQLKLLLVQRLDQLSRRFIIPQTGCQLPTSDDLDELESRLVRQVQALSGQRLFDVQEFPKAGQHNLTLLHLAAGLGFAKLISCLIRWRMATDCVALEFDVDAQSVDSHSCTPLVEQLEIAKEQERRHQEQEFTSATMDLSCSPGQGMSEQSPSTITSDLGSSLPPGSCPTPGDDSNLGPPGVADANFIEKDGAEMKDDDDEVQSVAPCVGSLSVQASSPFPFSRPTKPGPKLVRRFSEQTMNQHSKALSKRNSVDLLPSGQSLDEASLPGLGSPSPSHSGVMRDSSPSQSQLLLAPTERRGEGEEKAVVSGDGIASLPDMSDMAFVVPPAPRLMLEEKLDEPSGYPRDDDDVPTEEEIVRRDGATTSTQMDTDETVPHTTNSPLIDVERISSDEEVETNKDGSKHQMVTLANQIIAAIPERIKLSPSKVDDGEESITGRGRSESHSSLQSQGSPRLSSFGDDSGISTPMTDSLAFDDYRYPELGTPSSSLSPDSTCLPSPYSPYSFTLDSPPPTTAEFTEYFNAPTTYMEKDFSQLTLSDQEQRKLYEAAKVIQNAYRHYRDKQQQKEIEAAILIQSYYRRYKTVSDQR